MREERPKKWAKLVQQFHKSEGIPWADACNCSKRVVGVHKWGERPDGKTCPARNTRRQKDRMDALGEVINGR